MWPAPRRSASRLAIASMGSDRSIAVTEPARRDSGIARRPGPQPYSSIATGAKDLTVIDVTLAPGKGHNFHKHPDQEEVIVVISGQVEQWLDREKRLLGPGDSVFIPAGIVHASFNAGSNEARLAAILGPCVGEIGYVSVEMGAEAPWNTLRQ